MKTIKFEHSNREFTRQNGSDFNRSTETVHFFTNGTSTACCVKPTFIERIRILFGERIWLITQGSVAPIFDMTTENPFVTFAGRVVPIEKKKGK